MATAALFGSFLLFLLVNIPIPFALGMSTAVALLSRGDITLMLIPQRMVPAIDSFALLAIPLFIFVGEILNVGGCGRRLVNFADALVGHITGGLAHANILASIFFGGISGSASADTAAIGSIMIPTMSESGYDKGFATVVTICSSPLGTIIPPSIVMVLFGWLTGASVARLFLAGLVPGVLIGLGLMVISYFVSKKNGYGNVTSFNFRNLWVVGLDAMPALLMPVIILGGIFGGIFTPTEAAAVAVVYGIIVTAFVYKELKLKDIPGLLMRTCRTTGGVMLLIAFSATFGWLMTAERVPLMITQFALQYTSTSLGFLAFTIMISLVVGCFLTPTSALIILVPLLFPVTRILQIDPVHFGLVLLCALALGHVTPPVGLCLYIGSSISEIPISKLVKPLMPYLAAMLLMVIILALFPALTLTIPNLFFN